MQNGFLEERLFQIGNFVDVLGVLLGGRLPPGQLFFVENNKRMEETLQPIQHRQMWRSLCNSIFF